LAQEVGAALGAQAGEQGIRSAVTDAGFTRFRRAAQTLFNLVCSISSLKRGHEAPAAI